MLVLIARQVTSEFYPQARTWETDVVRYGSGCFFLTKYRCQSG